jgi:Tfp pilus assembly protein FimT
MKISIPKSRRIAGIMLTECLVYLAIFSLLTGIGLAAFYLCWNNSQALVFATDDIGAALRAGERWRADVRNATGTISLEPSAAGERVRIPGRDKLVVYRFETGGMYREVQAGKTSELLLPRIDNSHMSAAARNGVTAWRWELQLKSRRQEAQLPLLFTFEAAQTKP